MLWPAVKTTDMVIGIDFHTVTIPPATTYYAIVTKPAHGTLGAMRAYAKIDGRGRIYLLAPPQEGESPRETAQPTGFPVDPRKI